MIAPIVLVAYFVLAFVLSTLLIRIGIPWLKQREGTPDTPLPESTSTSAFSLRSVGLWIGFFEMLIVFALVCQREFSALAIIIGAKEFVRKEQIKGDPAYYLLGTLINVGLAVIFALSAQGLIGKLA